MFLRIIANLISIAMIICFYCTANYTKDLTFFVFTLPYILSNTAVLIMLVLSTFNKPKDTSNSIGDFITAVIGTNLGIILGLLNINVINPNRNMTITGVATLITIGIIPVYIIAVFTLGKSLSVIPEAKKLKTNGIYSISRHPLYTIYIIWFVLQILVCQSFIAAVIAIIQITLEICRAKNEEKILMKNFPEYTEYKNKVGWLGIKI